MAMARDMTVVDISYSIGKPGMYASIAIKWVDHG
jgi:hypothetical protein